MPRRLAKASGRPARSRAADLATVARVVRVADVVMFADVVRVTDVVKFADIVKCSRVARIVNVAKFPVDANSSTGSRTPRLARELRASVRISDAGDMSPACSRKFASRAAFRAPGARACAEFA